ncbi:MAG: M48 family peptidase [Spirochaetaceae bacterium]|nr:MAG: M48 family peptidase [Spirochaetaceae bacterium]
MGEITKRPIKYLKDIDPRTWEHPADRAALAALRHVPGLDIALKAFMGGTTEKSLRLLALAASVRSSVKQFPKIFNMTAEACLRLDVRKIPEVYISHFSILNVGSAAAVGMDSPFIILNYNFIKDLSDQELMAVIAHEVGHIMSGHMLYKTLLRIMIMIAAAGIGSVMPIAEIAIQLIISALMEWDRKSELTADRAGLLGLQSPEACYTLEMKMAGGADLSQMDINEFFLQAQEYDKGGNILDSLFKFLNQSQQTHPFAVLRLTELKTWVDSGVYQKILDGEYMRNGETPQDDIFQEFQKASDQYKEDIRKSKDPLAEAVTNAMKNFEPVAKGIQDFFGNFFKSNTPGGDGEGEKKNEESGEDKKQ